MEMSYVRESIVELVSDVQSQSETDFVRRFCNIYGEDKVHLAEDIANEIFGNQAGQTQKIFNMLADYDRRKKSEFLHKMAELGQDLIDSDDKSK
jgi:hypothetical protein